MSPPSLNRRWFLTLKRPISEGRVPDTSTPEQSMVFPHEVPALVSPQMHARLQLPLLTVQKGLVLGGGDGGVGGGGGGGGDRVGGGGDGDGGGGEGVGGGGDGGGESSAASLLGGGEGLGDGGERLGGGGDGDGGDGDGGGGDGGGVEDGVTQI